MDKKVKTTPAKHAKLTSTPKSARIVRAIIYILAFCAWTYLALELSALLFSYLFYYLIGPNQLSTPLWTTIYSAVMYTGACVLVTVAPYKLIKKFKPKAPDRASLGLNSTPTWTDIGLAPVGYIIYFLLAAFLTFAFQQIFPWFDINQAQNVGYNSYLYGTDVIIAFIALVIIAPIAEEIIFRGYLYGKLRHQVNLAAPLAALIVSTLFGFLHGQWNVGINVFALSLVLCALREITGTIYAGILLHILKNGIAFYLLYVAHNS